MSEEWNMIVERTGRGRINAYVRSDGKEAHVEASVAVSRKYFGALASELRKVADALDAEVIRERRRIADARERPLGLDNLRAEQGA